MNTQVEIAEEQSPGWNFDQKNLRNLFNPCTQIEMYMKTKLVRKTGVRDFFAFSVWAHFLSRANVQ